MSTLTDEELNEEICKWLGWRFEQRQYGYWWTWRGISSVPQGTEVSVLPNHIAGPEALGNMHEAEKKLSEDQCELYFDYLNEPKDDKDDFPASSYVIHATARQRATAFLHVVKPELFQ